MFSYSIKLDELKRCLLIYNYIDFKYLGQRKSFLNTLINFITEYHFYIIILLILQLMLKVKNFFQMNHYILIQLLIIEYIRILD